MFFPSSMVHSQRHRFLPYTNRRSSGMSSNGQHGEMNFNRETSTSTLPIKPVVYVKVTDEELADDPIELPLETDGTISLATVTAQFPGASGLKYRNPETGTFRGLRLDERAHVHPATDGWGDMTYIVVFPKENTKRKIDADHVDSSAGASKQKRVERRKCSDLIVLGLPYKTTEDELREYFEQFGEVIVSQVKRDPKTDKSKGFGFVRFTDYDSQLKVLSQRHYIDGRWCDVKIPNSKSEQQSSGNRKIFVGRVSENIMTDDLREFFERFGEVTDVFIPKPFRGFAFVTFADGDVAQALCGEDYVIRQVSVHVSPAAPKESSYSGSVRSVRSHCASGPSGGTNFHGLSTSPAEHRTDYYNYQSGPISPQGKMNRNQVWASFPSNSMGSSGSYGNPWNVGNGNGPYHHMQAGGDMNLLGTSSGGRMTPVPAGQPAPPTSAVVMPTSVNSQNAAASATNQATVGMGALNLGSFNISSLLNQALNPALNPALFAAAQAAILQTLAQTNQALTSGAPTAADISNAFLNSMPGAAQMAHGQSAGSQAAPPPPAVAATVSCAPAACAWWPAHTTSVVAAIPSSAVPQAAAVMTTTMSGEMVGTANGNQTGRPVGVWSQEESWRK